MIMIKRTVFSGLALAAVGGFLFSSCTNSTSPGTTVGAPSNLMALSQDATHIGIRWTRGANDTASEKIVLTNTTTGTTDTVPTTATQTEASLLVNSGTLYTIAVASSGGQSPSLQWMGADRTGDLQIYQFTSAQMSGLQLNGSDGQAHVVSASSANAGIMDFYLEDVENDPTITVSSGISFEGAQFLNGTSSATYRTSLMDGAQRYIPGGLDSDFSATNFQKTLDTASTPNYDIPNDAAYGSRGARVLLVKTQDGNFAKIAIEPNASGKLYSVDANGDKYITVSVSYQPSTGQPYASRPRPASSVRPARNSAH